jgi:hypothetical protein
LKSEEEELENLCVDGKNGNPDFQSNSFSHFLWYVLSAPLVVALICSALLLVLPNQSKNSLSICV